MRIEGCGFGWILVVVWEKGRREGLHWRLMTDDEKDKHSGIDGMGWKKHCI